MSAPEMYTPKIGTFRLFAIDISLITLVAVAVCVPERMMSILHLSILLFTIVSHSDWRIIDFLDQESTENGVGECCIWLIN